MSDATDNDPPRWSRGPGRPRELPCGAPGNGGARRHRRNGEDPCEACADAERAHNREQYLSRLAREGREPVVRELEPCGSRAAYRRHRRNGEDPCEACADAMSKYNAAQYQRRTGAES